MTFTPITETITACRDPKDDKFLELAVSGQANLIISSDNDLLVLYLFFGITVQASGLVILTTEGRKDLSFIETLALRHRLRRGARCTSDRSFVAGSSG